MLFHVGTLWRLYEAGMLRDIKRISSVSGGSITAGLLGLKWSRLSFDPGRVGQDFTAELVAPIRALASKTIDIRAILGGLLLPGRVGDRVQAAYDSHLFGGATLQELPDRPRFVINATNVQSGVLWRFMKPYMRDYRVGEVKNPTIPLALAVAASSAFPPVLSPVEMKLAPGSFTPRSGKDLQREPFTSKIILSDGGVYDNMGLETAWKRYDTILVSDAGGKMQEEAEPKSDWARHAYRVLNIVDNQVRSLRKRQVIDSFKSGARKGAYWGIRTDIADYRVTPTLDCPHARTLALAAIETRLAALDDLAQERLINWGYAVCDAALRKHVVPGLPAARDFPYPAAKV
jgi:NTE family protein